MKFQLDRGAQCNVIPLHMYVKAIGEKSLDCVHQSGSSIVSFGGSKTPLVGLVFQSLEEMLGAH